MLSIVLFWCLHIGIGLTMMIGIFPYVGVVALLGLLPGNVMDRVQKVANSPKIARFGK